ncbi:Zinc finger RING-type [Penicillium chermesinum]|nr:Zinc finger RING-type [Penicillium chermesinum]
MNLNLQDFLAVEADSDVDAKSDYPVDLRALDFVSSYDSHLMCPICHCPLVQPVRLQCDHVFCDKCLRSAITSFRSTDAEEFPCPSCRTPTSQVSTSVPRLLINMCDDIQVRCPLSSEGCPETVPRGHVQSHVDKYCGYRLVPCPDKECGKKTRKMDLEQENRCRHSLVRCTRCEEDIMEQDFEEHDNELCSRLQTLCVDCGTIVLQREFKRHVETCLEVVSPCTASKYGCPVKVRRAEIAIHEQQCPLVAIGPYFEAQNTRLNSLEVTMRHLQQRNEILEDGLANLQPTICVKQRSQQSEDIDEPNDRSSTYLLSVHESLRDEVAAMSHALTDLDARASMTIMSECLRIKEDMAHTNAAVNSVRMQVQWLMNPSLHSGTRAATARQTPANSASEARSTLPSTSAAGPSNTYSYNSTGPLEPTRPRRPSDSGREGTKL